MSEIHACVSTNAINDVNQNVHSRMYDDSCHTQRISYNMVTKNCEELESALFDRDMDIEELKQNLDDTKVHTHELDQEITHLREQVVEESDAIDRMAHAAQDRMVGRTQLNTQFKELETQKATL
ncbi:hypothetical protein SARC_09110 [Sphaeroforma arctica JP610]|uniref:Uncharacterized protein n=1 Tax=Sphaeroforma arctica JP610 TaxID=667725 RepID=A0A0L0FR27_9EUKA|nr:hypothetical protein SARC_09110 [Sphaeroforma arctica JP610]KNC78458.1 hypothetical protein SARC_09110 [Sphaeroforma arctica JP610]|eukprot:XP_014152360.1 hypothetical protein SARC_09110 [Sphaeroforma arctica JP610]